MPRTALRSTAVLVSLAAGLGVSLSAQATPQPPLNMRESIAPSRITSTSADPTEHVDPLIGTSNLGDVFPGAMSPFGMFSFSPETSRGNAYRTAAPGGYLYSANKIRGFSLTHMSGT